MQLIEGAATSANRWACCAAIGHSEQAWLHWRRCKPAPLGSFMNQINENEKAAEAMAFVHVSNRTGLPSAIGGRRPVFKSSFVSPP